jgi:hypothetical protein
VHCVSGLPHANNLKVPEAESAIDTQIFRVRTLDELDFYLQVSLEGVSETLILLLPSNTQVQKNAVYSKLLLRLITHSPIDSCLNSLIPQLFSWGKLQITLEAFQRIYTVKCISPNILHVLQEFGSKTCDGLPCNCPFQSCRSDYQMRTYGTVPEQS